MEKDLIAYLKNPALMDASTLTTLRKYIDKYPLFQTARMLYLKNLHNINSYKFDAELKKQALFITNRKQLFLLLKKPIDRQNKDFELLPINESIFLDKPAIEIHPSYSGYQLEDVETTTEEKNQQTNLIDRFIELNPTIKVNQEGTTKVDKTEIEKNNTLKKELITDTLAKIYIQQEQYEKAIDAYRKLILKFPEKNVYFASQIEKINQIKSKK